MIFRRSYQMLQTLIWLSAILALILIALVACRSSSQEVVIREITPLKAGGEVETEGEVGIAFVVDNPGNLPLTYEWIASKGNFRLASQTTRSAVYVAPDTAGTQLVTVQAVHNGQVVAERSIQIEVIEPAKDATSLLTPTDTSKPTEVPNKAATTEPTKRPTQTPTGERAEEPTESATSTTPLAESPIPTEIPMVEVSIERPQGQVPCPTEASCRFSVQGEIVGIEPGSDGRIVVFVNPGDPNLWWPHPVPSTGIKNDGTWEGEAQIGDKPEQPGHQFNIVAVAMSAEEAINLENTFQKLPEGIARSSYVDLITASADVRPDWCVPFPRPPASNITLQGQAELTFPEDCAELEYINVLAGISSDIPEDVHIWVLVYPNNRRYYPQSDDAEHGLMIETAENGTWSITTYLGTPDSGAEKFDIVVVLANDEASDFFRERLMDWATSSNYPGLSHAELPAGIMEVQSITVVRAR